MSSGIKRLDIGCGTNKVPGSIYLDVDENAHPDILHDLNKFPYPVEDNSFDEIYAKHIIEHLDDPQKFLAELCRILKRGGDVHRDSAFFKLCRLFRSSAQIILFIFFDP